MALSKEFWKKVKEEHIASYEIYLCKGSPSFDNEFKTNPSEIYILGAEFLKKSKIDCFYCEENNSGKGLFTGLGTQYWDERLPIRIKFLDYCIKNSK